MTRAVSTRRLRFLPYRYDEHGLTMSYVRGQLDGSREAPGFDAEQRVLDLSSQRFETAELRFAVAFDRALLEGALPPDEREQPRGRLVIRAMCGATRIRRSIVLLDGALTPGVHEGALRIRHDEMSGTVELTPMLVRATERAGSDDGYASAACSQLASGRGIEVRIDAARPTRGEYLDIRYESFREVGPPKYREPAALYQLDCDGDAPVLWLNTDHQRVCAVLEAAGTVGRAARLRDLLFAQISTLVWGRLFWRSARDAHEAGEALHEWQDAVLAKYLPRLYPDAPDHESRFEALREELEQDHQEDLAARLDLLLQDDLELAGKAESLAQELG